jgi:hypothetical protein
MNNKTIKKNLKRKKRPKVNVHGVAGLASACLHGGIFHSHPEDRPADPGGFSTL